MGVQAQITRLEEAKAALVSAIIAKGVTVPEGALLDALSAYVSQIETGADVSGVTAAAADVTAGKKFVTAAGVLTDGTMAEVTQATPSITVSSEGLITASATQSAGKVAAGTESATKQLTTQAAKTVTPTTSEQVAVAAGVYTTGAVKVAAVTYTMFGRKFVTGSFTPTATAETIQNISHSLGEIPTGIILFATSLPSNTKGLSMAMEWFLEKTNWTHFRSKAMVNGASEVNYNLTTDEYWDASLYAPTASVSSGWSMMRAATTSKFSLNSSLSGGGSGNFVLGITYRYILFGGI